MSSKLEGMFGKGWYQQLEPFLTSSQFRKIGNILSYEAGQLKEITPKFEDTFRAFKECPWERVHTVLLGMDPYPGKINDNTYVADGIAFSSRHSQKCPDSLRYIFRALEEDIYKGESYVVENYDLTRWANQGILLINCALSFPRGEKSGSHFKMWQPFITEVLRIINEKKDSIAIGLMDSDAKLYKSLLTNATFSVATCDHPASAIYRKGRIWDHNAIFTKITGFHKFMNNIQIKW